MVRFGRNSVVRVYSMSDRSDLNEKTVQQYISESFAGGGITFDLQYGILPELRRMVKGRTPTDLPWIIKALEKELREYRRKAADMSIGWGCVVTVHPEADEEAA